METCSKCGATTIGENCHRCGYPLQLAEQLGTLESREAAAPTVELISRGHSVIEVDAVEVNGEVLKDPSPPPVPPGAVEITVDEITVIADDAETEEVDGYAPDEEAPQAIEATDEDVIETPATQSKRSRSAIDGDRWDHLRPHGDMPKLVRRVSLMARVVEALAVLTAIAGLGAAGIHFYLNTRVDAAARGNLAVTNLDDIELIAGISLIVVAGLATLAILAFLLWKVTGHSHGRMGRTGSLAWMALAAGIVVVVVFYLLRRDTVTEAIAANVLIILGLGLIVSAFVVLARLVDRLDPAGVSEPH